MVKQKEVATMVEEKETKKQVKDTFGLEEVTQVTGLAIKNLQTGEVLTQEQFFVLVLNKLDRIEKVLG